MKKLTIVASNRNRLDLESNITKFFIKSLEVQTNKDFEVVIADGGSDNYEELKEFFSKRTESPLIRIVQLVIGEEFERARLNNVGIRNSTTEYVMTTDVDMLFGPGFVNDVISILDKRSFVESRTLYLRDSIAKDIWEGNVDPFSDIDSCKIGRIKKRTSAGGCQCTHIDNWNRLRGFNEDMVGWGSEDVELLKRANNMGLRIKWIGEERETINLFHQPHKKISIKKDLEAQEKNKKIYRSSRQSQVNINGWGGISFDKEIVENEKV